MPATLLLLPFLLQTSDKNPHLGIDCNQEGTCDMKKQVCNHERPPLHTIHLREQLLFAWLACLFDLSANCVCQIAQMLLTLAVSKVSLLMRAKHAGSSMRMPCAPGHCVNCQPWPMWIV